MQTHSPGKICSENTIMEYVYSAYVAQCEVSHSYNKGVPKNITYGTHSYQHKYQQELESLTLGLGLFRGRA